MVLWQYCVLRERLGNQKEHTAKNPSYFVLVSFVKSRSFLLFSSFSQQVASTNISKLEPI